MLLMLEDKKTWYGVYSHLNEEGLTRKTGVSISNKSQPTTDSK